MNGMEEVLGVMMYMDGQDAREVPGTTAESVECAGQRALDLGRLMMHVMHPTCHGYRVVMQMSEDGRKVRTLMLPGPGCSCAHPGKG